MKSRSRFHQFALGAVVAMGAALASAASAATVTLTYNGGTSNGSATIVDAPAGSTLGSTPWTVGAYGFNMSATPGDTPLGPSFVAWCLDLANYLTGTHQYQITDTPTWNTYIQDAGRRARIQAVFDANYATLAVTTAVQAAGFQVALWNALYDDDWSVTNEAGAGDFAIGSGSVRTQANAYLLAASTFSGPRAYNLSFLQSTARTNPAQNLVTASPVPLPAAGWLMIAGLGALAALRRRRAA